MVNVELRPMGERAVLAETASLADALALHRALTADRLDGVDDLVPAARTVLVPFDAARVTGSAVRAWIARAAEHASTDAVARGRLVELSVRYDGPDLASTAELLGLGVADLVARHRDAEWVVAFTGFAPGFGYLVSDDWPFDVPRLAAPRTRVPAGAVGVAAGFSGAYPRETPGGWRLIATTDAALFDPTSASPVLLPPGTRVRFVATPARTAVAPPAARDARSHAVSRADAGATASRAGATASRAQPRADAGARGFRVDAPGLLATVQDLGRGGLASLGIARSGALDRAALRRANRLVGNPEGAAGVEITLGGFRATAAGDLWIALAGARGPAAIDGRPLDAHTATRWPAGTVLDVGWFDAGARGYLAVRGGIATDRVAGSRATDTLAGLGPQPLAAGAEVPVGEATGDIPALDIAPWGVPDADVIEIELAPGARADWFASTAPLFDEVWEVTADTDRVGMRLDGPELVRVRSGELPSEGMVPGALQVPPAGRPVILLADGPVTGGYPVIAVATEAGLDALAQARPGTRLRFRHAPVQA